MDLGRHLLGRLLCTTPVSTPLPSSSSYVVAIRSIWEQLGIDLCSTGIWCCHTAVCSMFSQHFWPLHNFHVDRSISLLFQIKAGVVVAATPNGRNSKHVYAYICVWLVESSKKHAHPRTSLVQFGSLSSSKYYIFITSQNIFCNYICMQLAV
jgi:hypothetical protein